MSNTDPKTAIPVVDDSCIGCGICANIAAQTFEMQETTTGLKSVVTNPQGNEKKEIQESIDICPVMAIQWQAITEEIKKNLQN